MSSPSSLLSRIVAAGAERIAIVVAAQFLGVLPLDQPQRLQSLVSDPVGVLDVDGIATLVKLTAAIALEGVEHDHILPITQEGVAPEVLDEAHDVVLIGVENVHGVSLVVG